MELAKSATYRGDDGRQVTTSTWEGQLPDGRQVAITTTRIAGEREVHAHRCGQRLATAAGHGEAAWAALQVLATRRAG